MLSMLKFGMIRFRHIYLALVLTVIFCNEAISNSMIEIPAGEFKIGGSESQPPNDAFLETFFIGKTEVTNGDFANKFSQHKFPPGAEEHPATNISWIEAKNYCQSLNSRLPTEEEWEKAARGTDGRTYPWGNKLPRKSAHPFISGVIKRKAGTVKHDYSPYGLYGMAGSVWEWTSDSEESKKVVRGGLWNLHLDFEFSKTFDRNFISPEKKFIFLGFRCARSE
jgi:formylglycine-generating enzyme required for sulfatase activity